MHARFVLALIFSTATKRGPVREKRPTKTLGVIRKAAELLAVLVVDLLPLSPAQPFTKKMIY